MLAHRQYTAGYGDALAGSLTYALLVCVGPAVILASTVASLVGLTPVHAAIARADAHLPAEVAVRLNALPSAPLPLRLGLLVALVWTSLRLVRATRTSVRAMCAQPAGSGNPVRDAVRDAGLGALLLLALTVAVTALAAAGGAWAILVANAATAALFVGIMRYGSWPGTGRPALVATVRAALVATVVVDGLTALAQAYVVATAAVHDEIYRAAGGLVAGLVWSSLCCRTLLRATAWAATAGADRQPVTAARQPLWVVIPAYNEAASIGPTLAALAGQTDRDLTLVVVDNASTDTTADVVREFARTAPFPVAVIPEPERGAGTAADTGFRYAIAGGAALLLRTDADSVPAPDWVAAARAALARGIEMACGRSLPRRDEHPTPLERWLLPAVTRMLARYGRYRPTHRGRGFRAPYVLCHGHNIALTAQLYLRCGGTPREPLHAGAEDVTLLNRARSGSARVARVESMVVQTSLRRLRAWGVRRTLLWHWDRRYVPAEESGVHVR